MKTIALAVLLATTFAVAQDNASTHPTVYRLEYTITEVEGAKKLSSRSYSLQAEEGKPASMRVGTRVPIPNAAADGVSYTYMDVGVNLDVTASVMEATTIRLKTNVDISSLITPDPSVSSRRPPATRQTRDQVTTVIPLDKPVILTTQDDPNYNTTMQVQVIARIVKER
jgi:Flp pilus assembly secretin CpaC